ncbi:MAG: hypothetical protein LBR23_00555 [Spirochaetaceae bacterium]|jgi:hypothetical protein|nr:hypothetical protein [Spirochaetaceae bacterium]
MKSDEGYKKFQNEPSLRILELRQKIKDRSYLDNAVQRIAFVMSRQLVEDSQAERKF